MNIKNLSLSNIYKLLLIIFIAAFVLRTALINTHLFFGPEQGIDLAVVKNMVLDHKLTLIGAKTDISGIFHGPIYYYVMAIPFMFSQGDPIAISLFFILLNSCTIFFLYLLGKEIKNERTGLLASLIFAFSFNSIVYSRWLSTHPLAIPLASLTFLFLIYFLKGSKKSLLGFSFFLGLLMQSEFLNVIFFSAITFFIVIVFFNKFKKENILFLIANFFLVFGIALGPYLLFDLRHKFLITNNILKLVGGEGGYYISLFTSFSNNISASFSAFSLAIIPFKIVLGVIIFTSAIAVLINEIRKGRKLFYILLIWLFVPLLILIFLRHAAMEQFFVALIPGFIILSAILVDKIFSFSKKMGILLVAFFVIYSLWVWKQNIPYNHNVFFQSTQPNLRYSDQLDTIDNVYKEADGKIFGIQTYTIPYWSQQGWEYLFWSYGYKKYHYLPTHDDPQLLFVIVQDDPNNYPFQNDWLGKTVKNWGKEIKIFKYGILTTKIIFLHK